MANNNEMKDYVESLVITDVQHEIIIGVLLGDACLELSPNGKSCRLIFEQSKEKHGDYLMHLYEQFQEWVTKKPEIVIRNKSTGRPTESLFFRTVFSSKLMFYYNLFYPKGKKVIPANIQSFLTDRTLAYWYMDDGALKGKDRSGKRLHTEGFTQEEVDFLADTLTQMGIPCTKHKQNHKYKGEMRTYYIVYITAKGDRIFTPRIKPYVIDSMLYKL